MFISTVWAAKLADVSQGKVKTPHIWEVGVKALQARVPKVFVPSQTMQGVTIELNVIDTPYAQSLRAEAKAMLSEYYGNQDK